MVEDVFCVCLYKYRARPGGMRPVYNQSRTSSSASGREFTHPVTVNSITMAVAETFNNNAYRASYRNVRDTTQKEKHP